MPEETFVIDSSKLDEAHITSDRNGLQQHLIRPAR